ncbi:PASTA domain-containing protein [Parasediminibacterium sp. JCM 36343]|uniref:PASTA domain-containing protein n=1 Tax=Parasediminibacterium sp. JCM 36343 TaxID=3374279 RepID=UPI00397C84EF
MFKSITSKPLWVNILVASLSSVILILLFFTCLGWITGHGKYEKVPDIVGQNVYAAINNLQSKGFKVEVSDSVFTTSVPGLTIIKQIPESETQVKYGRTIYLTVNRAVPPLIDMPSLIGFSYKSAEIYLQSLGLKMGDTTYKPDFAKNAILDQLFNKESLKPGTKIPVGSKIDFVLGSGVGDKEMDMPDVVGLTLLQAKDTIMKLGLGVGSIVAVPQGSISDSSGAFVIRQNPGIFTEAIAGQRVGNKIHQGATLDLYISITPPIKDSTNTYPQDLNKYKK